MLHYQFKKQKVNIDLWSGFKYKNLRRRMKQSEFGLRASGVITILIIM